LSPVGISCKSYYFLRDLSKARLGKPGKTCTNLAQEFSEHNKITGLMSRYKRGPKIYRARVSLAGEPTVSEIVSEKNIWLVIFNKRIA